MKKQGTGIRGQGSEQPEMIDFICTRKVILTDDCIERLRRHDKFDVVVLEERGIKLVMKNGGI